MSRGQSLLAPRCLGPPNGDPAHAGTIITDRPDVMWGTDATRFSTEQDGWCWGFGAIDHGIDELLGWHVAKIGDRWAALEPIRQGVRHAFGAYRKDVARGLALRCDWGPQYIADAWIQEVKWLGVTISPSYVGEPECNGVIERFLRTLKEQCLYLHRFQTLEEAREVIAEFIARYNREWLIERLEYQTPSPARAASWRAPGAQALGDAVDEEVGDRELAEVAGGEALVLLPEPLGDLAHDRAAQKARPGGVLEGRLDVARAQPPGEHLERQALQLRRPARQARAHPTDERVDTIRHLGNPVLDRPFGRPQPAPAIPVAVAGARPFSGRPPARAAGCRDLGRVRQVTWRRASGRDRATLAAARDEPRGTARAT